MNISRIAQKEIYFVFIAALFLMIAGIWAYPVTILDEAKNAGAAREMFLSNHLFPTFNEILRTDKPPLHYFFMQLGYSIFGVNEFGARIFGAILGAGFMAGFYNFLRYFSGLNLARLSTFILLSAFFWVQEFHLAVPDPYLLTFLCGAWLFFYDSFDKIILNNTESQRSENQSASNFIQRKYNHKNLWLFYVFIGLATLAKGPLAIGLTGLIILIFLIVQKDFRWKEFFKLRPLTGSLVVLLIAAPWFIWMHFQTNGTFTDGFFIRHNFQRFGSEMEGHGGIFLITWAFVILGLFPFGAFIPQAILHAIKFMKRKKLILYSFIISLVVIVFFSISSTKLPNYTLPAIPFLAILCAGFFEEVKTFRTLRNPWNLGSLILIVLVGLAIPVAVFVLFEHPVVNHLQIVFTILATVIVVIGTIYVRKYYLKLDTEKLVLSIGAWWMVCSLFIFYLIYPNLSKAEPVMQAAEIMEKNEIVVFGNYDPAFNFNYNRSYREFHDEQSLKKFLSENPDVLILTKDKRIKDSKYIQENFQQVFNQPSLFENYRTIILKKW